MNIQASVKDSHLIEDDYIDSAHAELSNVRVVIISDAAPERNGVGSYYHDLERYLKDHVEFIETICPKIQGKKWSGGINVPLPGDATQKFVIPNFFSLKKRVKQLNPNVIIIPSPALYGLFGAVIGKQLGVKVIIGFHTWFDKLADLYWKSIQRFIVKKYFEYSHWLIFKFGDVVLANSDYMMDIAKHLGAKKTGLMGTPIAYEFVKAPIKPISYPPKRVIFAGRLAAEKNIQSVIQAAMDHPDMQFIISGDGPERESIQAAANNIKNLTYLGWLNRHELLNQIDNSDILVLPSLVEGFGTIALEALVRGRMTAVSDNCGIIEWPELVDSLYIFSNEDGFSKALHRITATQPEQIKEKIDSGRNAALKLNNWNFSIWNDVLVGKQ
ncbi:glycosyltransferase [Teredinibacter sp. KSP-S5-2]|uniref:glycosyltransferase n=1 Tax=Teredinibacter sp. KSP-S5-2 TaxID=3034506 RepID=UPI002934DA89|nr:glycosyltransferase [Teredinibacter sp. KSP-S5-2]WNO10672.1 glycosyltransferase [Teredinibacter sp. KSP-S5-2]